MAKITFLGLGVMGYPMAGHLQAKGHSVTVYNRTREKSSAWVAEYGGAQQNTPRAAAEGAEFVMACVGNDHDLRSVVLGDDGVLLRDAAAGDAVRVSVLLADTVDVVVFFISSTLGFVAGVLVVTVLVVEAGVLAPTALVEAPAGVLGLVIGDGLDDIGVTLEGVAGVGLVVVVGRVVGFAGAADFVTPLVLLAAVAPDAGLLIGDVEPDTGGLVVVLDVVLAIGLGAGAFVLGFKGVADAPAGLDVTPVVLTGAGFVPRLSAGDAVRFSSTTFFSSGFFVSLISSTGGSVTIVTGIISSVSFLSSLWSVTSIASSITSGTGVAGVKLTIGAAKTSVSLSLSDCKLV